MDALLILYKNLYDKNIEWAVGGDFGEVLRTVNEKPTCIEILTSKEDAEKIVKATLQFNPLPIETVTHQLPRNAVIRGEQYPIYIRSHYSEFNIGFVKVEIYGDAQYRINNWDWGDEIEFDTEDVNVVGKRIAVVSLSFKYDFYRSLGWTDRAEKIKQTLDKQKMHAR